MKRALYLAATLAIACSLALPATAAATSKVKYKWSKGKPDEMKVAHRVEPATEGIDPWTQDVKFVFRHSTFGSYFIDTVQPLFWASNARGNVWKFKLKKDNDVTPIYFMKIKEKFDKQLAQNTYILKLKLTADLSTGDPDHPVNAGVPVDVLDDLVIEFFIGDDVFFLDTQWERKPFGWLLRDKYLQADTIGGGTMLYVPPTSTTTTTLP
jgi:hypothetical protein